MPIPDFQSIMLPLLEFCADGKEHTNREALDTLAARFGLTEEERKMMLPSGQARLFDNRVAWARAHIKTAMLLENPRRGVFHITDRGVHVLRKAPEKIDLHLLKQFSEYNEARAGNRKKAGDNSKDDTIAKQDEAQTPKEQIEQAYEAVRKNLARELLSQLKSASPAFFEKVVVEVLVKMGYGGTLKDAGQAIGGSGDEGIDGIIKEDRLGLDIIYIQAKKMGSNGISTGDPEICRCTSGKEGQERDFYHDV